MATNHAKPPLRERRYRETLNAIERTKARREAAIRTLVKCESLLPKLERKARRLGAPPPPPKAPTSTKVQAPPLPTIEPEIAADGVPDFLRRSTPRSIEEIAKEKDEIAKAEILAKVEAEKKRKAAIAAERREIKAEMLKAELTGQRRRMPLTGKAALEALK